MFHSIFALLFPPRCVLCHKFLQKDEQDFCHDCRKNAPVCEKSNFPFSFLAGWTAVWYYKDTVRKSILRFKFAGQRSYGSVYGRVLAMKLQEANLTDFDLLTWVPVSPLRRLHRGYDQVELLVNAVGKELGVTPCKTLRKFRHTPPQSGINNVYRRRANVLGVYKPVHPENIGGKRILLLDDVITTGATVSECAKTLLAAGAKAVYCGAIAVSEYHTKKM